MGTPTMGGIVMLIGLVGGLPRLAVHVPARSRPAGLALLFAAVGFGIVGFLDDFIKVRRERSLGLSKSQKFLGTAIVSVLFAFVGRALRRARPVRRRSCRSSAPTGLDLGVLFYVWAFVILTSSSHAVNLTDGLDGLASGSSILVLVRVHVHRVLAVPARVRLGPPDGVLRDRPGRSARHRDRGRRHDGRGHGVPVVERGAREDLHGRHGRARAGRRCSAPWRSRPTRSSC